MLKARVLKVMLAVAVSIALGSSAMAKSRTVTESIQIDATPQAVFDAIKSYRTSSALHRHLVSYDGQKAVVDETLEGVPVFGQVHCTWIEKEVPFQRIDYTMLNSDKFVSGSGSYVILPGTQPGYVTLQLNSELDSGCHIPFAKEMGQMAAHKDMKTRLQLLKHISEETKIAQSR